MKKTEKNNTYKKKSNWPLKELKLVDGIDGNKVCAIFSVALSSIVEFYQCISNLLLKLHNSNLSFSNCQETAEFSLTFDKVYQWSASNVQERLLLFSILWKLCSKYFPKQSPMFMNIPAGIMEDTVIPEASTALDHEGYSYKLQHLKEEF